MVQNTTMGDVAKAAGVHQSTVSRALKNDRRLSKETCKKIQDIAHKLGYKPNPLVSALIAERHKNRSSGYGSVVAFLTSGLTRCEWYNMSPQGARSFHAVESHLAARGYTLENFWLKEPGMTPQRMRNILIHRGIRGIVVCPLSSDAHTLDFDFTDFTAVALGNTLQEPKLDHVSVDYSQIMRETLQHFQACGCQGIGFLTTPLRDMRTGHLSMGVFLTERRQFPDTFLEPLIFDENQDQHKVIQWVRTHAPKILIISTRGELHRVRNWLEADSYKIPDDLSLFCIDAYPEPESRESGMIQDLDSQGAAIAELLAGRIEHGIFGLPKQPKIVLVSGIWKKGKTLDPRIPSYPTGKPCVLC